jgi:serine/threonine protein phosphatase 1
MLKALFKSRKKAVQPGASIPPGMRVYAIGDVHGRLDLLKSLLGQIIADDRNREAADTQIILLGDLVDRGPDSAGVVETLRLLSQSGLNIRCIAGNHEEVMLDTITNPTAEMARFFYRIGGRETLLSYGLSQKEMDSLDFGQLAERMVGLVPPAHVEFLTAMENCIVIGDYAFVHAGISPYVPLENQQLKALRWIRDDFLNFDGELEKTIVYGHTITENVDFGTSRIGLDTGAYKTGKLTAMGLEGGSRWFLDTAADEAAA